MVMQTDPKSLNNEFLNRRWMTFFFNSTPSIFQSAEDSRNYSKNRLGVLHMTV